mmetsp:Transcript_53468/g.116568  ORF Transcript_53468/g.116568 Transcript_53468/m.116568 type:complete len:206 (+) Transcript_53468:1372-1989(+)
MRLNVHADRHERRCEGAKHEHVPPRKLRAFVVRGGVGPRPQVTVRTNGVVHHQKVDPHKNGAHVAPQEGPRDALRLVHGVDRGRVLRRLGRCQRVHAPRADADEGADGDEKAVDAGGSAPRHHALQQRAGHLDVLADEQPCVAADEVAHRAEADHPKDGAHEDDHLEQQVVRVRLAVDGVKPVLGWRDRIVVVLHSKVGDGCRNG